MVSAVSLETPRTPLLSESIKHQCFLGKQLQIAAIVAARWKVSLKCNTSRHTKTSLKQLGHQKPK